MELAIYWTLFAQNRVEEIFLYHKLEANIDTARKLTLGIINKTALLKSNPSIGQLEPLLSNRKEHFRYLVFKNYKIIYWHNKNQNRIEIVHVFDCRQNPTKMIEETQ